MDTSPAPDPRPPAGEGDTDGEEPAAPAVHYSTGRLTGAQAKIVDAWRARLREDKPLPGVPRVSQALRMLGVTDHPKASCSDAIAAAVADLLRDPPAPLALAGYAYTAIRAQRLAVQGMPGRAAADNLPASFYLPAELAGEAEQLRAQAQRDAVAKLDEIQRDADERFPGDTDDAKRNRSRYIADQVRQLGLHYTRQVPRGALARMAIERWGRHSPDRVAAAAVAWADEAHDQPHRARHDMRTLTTSYRSP